MALLEAIVGTLVAVALLAASARWVAEHLLGHPTFEGILLWSVPLLATHSLPKRLAMTMRCKPVSGVGHAGRYRTG